MNKIIVTKIKKHDIFKLKKLFAEAINNSFDYFTKKHRRKILKQNNLIRLSIASIKPDRVIVVAKAKQVLMGFLIGNIPSNHIGQIHWLYVKPNYRKLNIGNRLLEIGIKQFKKQKIHKIVLMTHNNKNYYLKKGFKIEKIEKEKYQNTIMYIMSIKI